MRHRSLILVALLPLIACESAQEEPPAPPVAAASTLWRSLGDWSGSGNRQTESFDVTTGSMRLTWEALQEGAGDMPHFRVSLHSAISGRPLQTIVDTDEAGSGTADLAASQRVAYLLIESEQIRWRLTLQEGVAGSPVSESARD
jgi:hypothetical protein